MKKGEITKRKRKKEEEEDKEENKLFVNERVCLLSDEEVWS